MMVLYVGKDNKFYEYFMKKGCEVMVFKENKLFRVVEWFKDRV